MTTPARHGHGIGEIRRRIGLTKLIGTPNQDRPVAPQRRTGPVTTGRGHGVANTRRHVRLAESVIAPNHHGAVTVHRQAGVVSGCDARHQIGQFRRHRGLAKVSGAPSHNVGLVKNLVEAIRHAQGVADDQAEMIRQVSDQAADLVGHKDHVEIATHVDRQGRNAVGRAGAPLEPSRGWRAIGRGHAVQLGAGTRGQRGR